MPELRYDPYAENPKNIRRLDKAMDRRIDPDTVLEVCDLLNWSHEDLFHFLRKIREQRKLDTGSETESES